MIAAKLRLAVTGLLFLAWLGWLGYLALVKPRPVVVSRSQMMVTPYPVEARIELDGDGRPTRAVVEQVLGPNAAAGPKVGAALDLPDLPSAHLPGDQPFPAGEARYLIPLAKLGENRYRVTAPPRSPGDPSGAPQLIYPWTPEVEKQVRELVR